MRIHLLGYPIVISALLTAPGAAADSLDLSAGGSDQYLASAHAGATISLSRSGEGNAQPRLSFGFGMRRRSAEPHTSAPGLIEYRPIAPKYDRLYFGGRRLAAAEGGTGLGTGEILLIIAGIAASAFVVTQLNNADDERDNDHERRCLVPEGCN